MWRTIHAKLVFVQPDGAAHLVTHLGHEQPLADDGALGMVLRSFRIDGPAYAASSEALIVPSNPRLV
jgi:hypothetical protein